MALVLTAGAFDLTGTQPRPLQRKANSGRTVTRWVCPDCGTWIWSGPKPEPTTRDALHVRAGTLDDTSWLRPTAHLWTRSAQPWVILPEEDRRFETQPDGPRVDASRDGSNPALMPLGRRSLLRHSGLVQPGEISRFEQGANLRHPPISGCRHASDARIRTFAP